MMTHLHDAHNIRRSDKTFEKYVYSHFERPVCCCGQCGGIVSLHCRRPEFKLFADKCPNMQRFKNIYCPEYYLFRGISVDDTIFYISSQQSKTANKSVTTEHLEKLSTINSGNNNPSSIDSIKARTGNSEREIRASLREKTSGSNNGFFGRKHKPETLRRMAKIRANQAKQISSPELIVWGMLHAIGIDFEYQVPIDKYVVDFKVDNVLIEVYGDYWHGKKMSRSKRQRDRQKEKFLSNNFKLLVIAESELVCNPQAVVKKLCELKK